MPNRASKTSRVTWVVKMTLTQGEGERLRASAASAGLPPATYARLMTLRGMRAAADPAKPI